MDAPGDESRDQVPSRHAGWTDAEIYIDLCGTVIDHFFTPERSSRQSVREWWRSEADHRREYKLSKSQSEALLERCRVAAMTLPERHPDDPPPAPEPDRKPSYTRRRRGAAV